VIYRYTDGKTKTYDLAYHQIMATTEVINGNMVGGLFDQKEAPLIDNNGQMASDAADGTSLLGIPGIRAADTARNHPLALVIQFEFKELPPTDGVSSGSFWSKLPSPRASPSWTRTIGPALSGLWTTVRSASGP